MRRLERCVVGLFAVGLAVLAILSLFVWQHRHALKPHHHTALAARHRVSAASDAVSVPPLVSTARVALISEGVNQV